MASYNYLLYLKKQGFWFFGFLGFFLVFSFYPNDWLYLRKIALISLRFLVVIIGSIALVF